LVLPTGLKEEYCIVELISRQQKNITFMADGDLCFDYDRQLDKQYASCEHIGQSYAAFTLQFG
jgi:hypothetical protein